MRWGSQAESGLRQRRVEDEDVDMVYVEHKHEGCAYDSQILLVLNHVSIATLHSGSFYEQARCERSDGVRGLTNHSS